MKKLILALTIIALIFGAVSCNGDVDEALFGNDFHYYEVQDNGSWVCSRNDCDHVLEGTEENKDYILVLNSKGQPGTVYPLETNNDLGLTVSGTTYTLNSEKAVTYYLRTSGGTLLVNTPNADVYRYGTIGEVAIYKVKNSSYHEFGTVKDIAILDGHLILGPTAEVDDLAVAKSKTGTQSVSFDFDESAQVKIFAIYDNQLNSVTVNGKAVSAIEQETEIAQKVVEITKEKPFRVGKTCYETVAEAKEAAATGGSDGIIRIVDTLSADTDLKIESTETVKVALNVDFEHSDTSISGTMINYGTVTTKTSGGFVNSGLIINFGDILNKQNSEMTIETTGTVENYSNITNETGSTVVNKGTLTIAVSTAELKNNGTITNESGATLEVGSGATLDNKGTLTNNGTVSNSGTVKGEIVGTGVIEASEDASFETTPDYVAQIFNDETAGKKYSTLDAAVNAAVSGSTIKLLNNVTLDNSIVIDKNITLDLNTKTIECSTYSFNISGDVVFTGNGTIHKNSYNGDISVGNNIQYNMINISGGSNVVVENGNYISKWPQVFTVNNSKLTFNSGVVKTDNSEQFIEEPFDTKSLILVDGEEAVINLYGGEFDSKSWHGEYLGLYGIFLKNGATLNAGKEGTTGPVIDSYYSAISSNGEYAPMTVNIFSGLFKSNLDYADAEEDMNVIGIYAQTNSGTLVNIYGGSFKQTAVNNNAHIFGIRHTASKTVNIFNGEFICKDTIFSFKKGSANNDIVITGGTYSSDPSEYVADGYCAVEDSPEDGMWSIGSLFAGGDGTENDPFLIESEEQFMCLSSAFDSLKEDIYFKIAADMDMSKDSIQSNKGQTWSRTRWFDVTYTTSTLHLDLAKHAIRNLDCFLFAGIQNIDVHDGEINFVNDAQSDSNSSVPGLIYYVECGNEYPRNLTFKDLVLTGQYEVNMSHYGPLVSQSYGGSSQADNILIDNVTSNVKVDNVSGGAYTGGMLGYVYGPLTIKNSSFNGRIQSPCAGGFINPMNQGTAINENNTFNGKLVTTNEKQIQKFGHGDDSVKTTGTGAGLTTIPSSDGLLKDINIGEEIVINHSDNSIVRYAISIMVWTNYSTNTTVFNVGVDAPQGDERDTGLYKYYFANTKEDHSTNETRQKSGWYDGCIYRDDTNKTYMVYCSSTTEVNNGENATIFVYGYDASGDLKVYQQATYSPKQN